MPLISGILSFGDLFTAKVPKAGGDPKFGAMVLIPATDPQITALLAEVNAAKQNTFPSGMPANANLCFDLYEKKITPDKEYHDPRFVGWYAFTCSAKADDRPAVVDMGRQAIIDPAAVYSGMMVHVSAGISGYVKGTGGVGGWLNGVMSTGELGQFGRLDGKPSTEQMFANVGATTPPAVAPAAPGAAIPAAPVALQMTAAANGVTLEQYLATPGWTEQMLIDQGLATRPTPVAPAAPAAAPAPAPAAPVAPAAPAPAAPAAPVAPAQLVMTAAANGVTYEQYMATPGWNDQMLLDQGLAIQPSFV